MDLLPDSEDSIDRLSRNRNERCDSCSAKAQFIVFLLSGELYFCGHHFKRNKELLEVISKPLAVVNLETGSRLK